MSKAHPALAKNPIGEVVFELRWELSRGEAEGFGIDPGFSKFQAKYFNFALEGDYPYLEKLPTSRVPEDMTPHTMRFRFRNKPDGYPLTQIGPGVLSVNHTSDYKWESFLPLINKSVKALHESYPTKEFALKPTRAFLKYINLIPYEGGEGTKILKFLEEKLRTKIAINSTTFDDKKQNTLSALRMSLNYQLVNPKGVGDITIGNSGTKEKPLMRLEITIISNNEDVPSKPEDYEKWLKDAHDTAYLWFSSLCEGDLMKSFA